MDNDLRYLHFWLRRVCFRSAEKASFLCAHLLADFTFLFSLFTSARTAFIFSLFTSLRVPPRLQIEVFER